MIDEIQNTFFDKIINEVKIITGVNCIFFLDSNYQSIKEHKINDSKTYQQEIQNLFKSEALFEKIGNNFYSKPFHTYTMLNEHGLIVITKMENPKENFYMVIIAGEKEPVDLINLLKTCKESRLDFENASKANV